MPKNVLHDLREVTAAMPVIPVIEYVSLHIYARLDQFIIDLAVATP